MFWLLDLYQVQHREPHQPASYRLYHHRPTLLHWNQREVRGANKPVKKHSCWTRKTHDV